MEQKSEISLFSSDVAVMTAFPTACAVTVFVSGSMEAIALSLEDQMTFLFVASEGVTVSSI